MQKFYQPGRNGLVVLLSFVVLMSQAIAQPKHLKITDFVIFGGRGPLPPGMTVTPAPNAPGGVRLGSASNIASGNVGSNVLISGDATIGDSVYSGGSIHFGNGSAIGGNVAAYQTILMGSSANITGDIDAGGDITIGGGDVDGKVTHPIGTTYVGPTPAGGEITGTPNLPIMPAMLPVTFFVASGTHDISSSEIIGPGSYGHVTLTGNQTLTLKGVGIYIFKSIQNIGGNTIKFDFNGSVTGNFKVLIEGDVDLNKSVGTLVGGGSASRIYCETHGRGTIIPGVAWNIANGSAGESQWIGSVWAPYAAINLGSGTGSSLFSGALYSGTEVSIQSGVNVEFAPFEGYNPADTVIFPDYEPPTTFKSDEFLGPELTSLCQTISYGIIPSPYIFRIVEDNILIEVVAKQGSYSDALYRLTNTWEMHNFIDNGLNSLIITGEIPIENLCQLNNDVILRGYVNSVRPLYPPITSGQGVASSGGDTAVHAHFARSQFNLSGGGVKVGILSDGFSTIPGALEGNIDNGDIPGDVDVIKDYPAAYGRTQDEGRAMLQIVHDLAPDAGLAFRTGFISEGDFAKGILELEEAGCTVIADDITYITAPFFKDGLAAKSVNEVKSRGVSYFSAAGNFGEKSYESFFNPATAPVGLAGFAHNFGGGDIFQNDSLKPGVYTVVLQWEDSIYSLGQGGALNDLDIYLTNDDGTIRFGMNRVNTGADPMEVLPFYVTADTKTNIMVVRAAGSGALRFKFIIFRGDLKMNEFAVGTSTVVGQANAEGAMAVGAARYYRTPAFGVDPALIETFSSKGGTPVYGTVRQKPDFTGPDGVNTTVNFNSLNYEGDLFPNFYGTSAAAPHAAAVAALVLEGKKKFYDKVLEPDSVRLILSNTSLDMADPGVDFISGSGLIQADAALASFANAAPLLDTLIANPAILPGTAVFTTTIQGTYFKPNSVVFVDGVAVPTTIISSTEATALIPTFVGNPPVKMYTPPITPSNLDGGYSNILYFFSSTRRHITVTANDTTKRYGEAVPAFTSTVLVDGIPLAQTNLTLANLFLNPIIYSTSATTQSGVGVFFIDPSMKPLSHEDSAIFELYEYEFNRGFLSNLRMPLLVTPRDTTITYGDKIGGFNFIYSYDNSMIPTTNRALFLANINAIHLSTLNNNVTALLAAQNIVNGLTLDDDDLRTMSVMASATSIVNAQNIINAQNIVNGVTINDTTRLLEVPELALKNYQVDSSEGVLVSATSIINAQNIVNATSIINATSIVNGTAIVNGVSIVNGTSIINSSTVDNDSTNSNTIVILGATDLTASGLSNIWSINMITGYTAGTYTIIPAAMLSDNFDIRYGLGKLTILKAAVTVTAKDTVILQGALQPAYKYTIKGLKNRDTVATGPSYITSPAFVQGVAGVYTVTPKDISLQHHDSYVITYVPGTLYVNPLGKNAKNVKPVLTCVDTLINHPSGFKYAANFSYTNDNTTPVFIARGTNNEIVSSGAFVPNLQPEVFLTGTRSFQVPFDGTKLRWILTSYNGTQKTAMAAEASAGSMRCKKPGRSISEPATTSVAPIVMLYPNPAKGVVTITTDKGVISQNDVQITDAAGKAFIPQRVTRISPQAIQVDGSRNMNKGVYFIKVKVDDTYKVLRVVKL